MGGGSTDRRGSAGGPLSGRRIVVTRPRHQSSRLAAQLEERGATALVVPTVEIVDPDDGGAALRAAVADLGAYDWIVLTSPNGAERFCAQLDGRGLDGGRVAVIGPGTAAVLARHDLGIDLVPDRFVDESLLGVFPRPQSSDRGRVLLARAAVARDVLPDGLRAMGWRVDVVDAYRNVPVVPDELARRLVRDADIVTFTSASAVDNWVTAFGAEDVPPVVACIGPVTADAATAAGLHVDVVPADHTIDGLVDAIVDHVASASHAGAEATVGDSAADDAVPRLGRP